MIGLGPRCRSPQESLRVSSGEVSLMRGPDERPRDSQLTRCARSANSRPLGLSIWFLKTKILSSPRYGINYRKKRHLYVSSLCFLLSCLLFSFRPAEYTQQGQSATLTKRVAWPECPASTRPVYVMARVSGFNRTARGRGQSATLTKRVA